MPKTVKGTQRHNFDCNKVLELIEKDKLTKEESNRILCEACQVIFGLRKDLGDVLMYMETAIKTRQFWITGKLDIKGSSNNG